MGVSFFFHALTGRFRRLRPRPQADSSWSYRIKKKEKKERRLFFLFSVSHRVRADTTSVICRWWQWWHYTDVITSSRSGGGGANRSSFVSLASLFRSWFVRNGSSFAVQSSNRFREVRNVPVLEWFGSFFSDFSFPFFCFFWRSLRTAGCEVVDWLLVRCYHLNGWRGFGIFHGICRFFFHFFFFFFFFLWWRGGEGKGILFWCSPPPSAFSLAVKRLSGRLLGRKFLFFFWSWCIVFFWFSFRFRRFHRCACRNADERPPSGEFASTSCAIFFWVSEPTVGGRDPLSTQRKLSYYHPDTSLLLLR